jgi:hypothetical protein
MSKAEGNGWLERDKNMTLGNSKSAVSDWVGILASLLN